MLNQFRTFLGPNRFNALVLLLVLSGVASLVFTFVPGEGALAAQTVLLLFFIVGAIVIIGSRLDGDQRWRALAIVAPAIGLVVLAIFYEQLRPIFLGGALGWLLVGMLTFGRASAPMHYREAIKAMRKSHYKEAVDAMSELIKIEPDDPNLYRFRANLFTLWGKLDRARRDYQTMLSLANNRDNVLVEAYDGLSGIDLQVGRYDSALEAAQKAYELVPDAWVTAYNLGLIYDRLQQPSDVLRILTVDLLHQVPESRHRLLICLYRLRAYFRNGDSDSAQAELDRLQKETRGLKDWQRIMESDQADMLRANFDEDVQLAAKLMSQNSLAPMAEGEPAR
ncbi:MAG: hypothetical protein KC546_16275 [Anaerolineae bacterium]|nr:hypothetical protein [Anaerolineae bacterium]